jgi:ParB/RepB/Spo0J family partition protein
VDQDARVLSVSSIVVRAQARKSFRRITELAADIRDRGQLQAVVVRDLGTQEYLLLSGERRLRAIRDELQHATILARIIRTDVDEQAWRLSQLAENLQREEYEPLELAREFAELKAQYGYSDADLAEQLHVNRTWVWRQLSLLDAPAHIQEAIASGSLAATEYLNNKPLYLNGLPAGNSNFPSGETANGSLTHSTSKSVSRISKVAIPTKTAQDMVEILKQLTHDHQLSPIVLGKKPTKEELLAVLTTRVQEIKQQMLSLEGPGLSPQS